MDSQKEFKQNEYLLKMLNDEKTHIKIIALLAIAKKIKFENKEQLQRFIKRNLRPAKELDCYSLEKIKKTLLYLLKNSKYKVGLETVIKYIDEDIDTLSFGEPIIILSSGEKIYSINKIKQLEKDGKIIYKNDRWREC